MIDTSQIILSVKTLFRRRQQNLRTQIILLCSVVFFTTFYYGKSDVIFDVVVKMVTVLYYIMSRLEGSRDRNENLTGRKFLKNKIASQYIGNLTRNAAMRQKLTKSQ